MTAVLRFQDTPHVYIAGVGWLDARSIGYLCHRDLCTGSPRCGPFLCSWIPDSPGYMFIFLLSLLSYLTLLPFMSYFCTTNFTNVPTPSFLKCSPSPRGSFIVSVLCQQRLPFFFFPSLSLRWLVQWCIDTMDSSLVAESPHFTILPPQSIRHQLSHNAPFIATLYLCGCVLVHVHEYPTASISPHRLAIPFSRLRLRIYNITLLRSLHFFLLTFLPRFC
ncbi:hypothetical protein J3A83DRAFT_1094505 [Scleroderma citrinum]